MYIRSLCAPSLLCLFYKFVGEPIIIGLLFPHMQEVSTVLLGLAKVPRPLRRLSSLLLSHLPSLTVLVHTLCSLSRAWALYNGNDMPGVSYFVERKK